MDYTTVELKVLSKNKNKTKYVIETKGNRYPFSNIQK